MTILDEEVAERGRDQQLKEYVELTVNSMGGDVVSPAPCARPVF
jgi:hypothetical protein